MLKQSWFMENKVLIIGLVSAIALPAYDLIKSGETSLRMILFAVFVGATGFLARNLRGQSATIAGILGTVLATFAAEIQTGRTIPWGQLAMQVLILYLAATSAPPKSKGYEQTDVIKEAKREGEAMQPSPAAVKPETPKPDTNEL